MTAIQHLLQRWGFVKLRSYGLDGDPVETLAPRPPVQAGSGTARADPASGNSSVVK